MIGRGVRWRFRAEPSEARRGVKESRSRERKVSRDIIHYPELPEHAGDADKKPGDQRGKSLQPRGVEA